VEFNATSRNLSKGASMQRLGVLVLGVSLAAIPVLAAGADEELPFEVRRLSDRVLVLNELSPWESNHVVIVSAASLVVRRRRVVAWRRAAPSCQRRHACD
jgi:hypothetical protein